MTYLSFLFTYNNKIMFICVGSLCGCERDGTFESGCRRRFARYHKININRFHHTMNSTLPLQAAAAKLFHNNIVNRIELTV